MKNLLLTLSAAMILSAASEDAAAQLETNNPGDRISGEHFATRSPVIAVNGVAATAHPLASQIAIDILKQGGNAVDAAIAANAALGLMEPTGNGIGGDLFAIIWDPETEQLYGLNASGRSPQGMSLEDLRVRLGDRDSIPAFGSLPVSVPGTVDGWFEMHERFGNLPMSDLLQPAIGYAEDGFPVTQLISQYFGLAVSRYSDPDAGIEETDNFFATYTTDGVPPAEGEIFRNPDLARTLGLIAEGGRDAFYRGEIANRIDAYMQRIDGPLRYEDFASHTSDWVEPQSVNYRGYDVWELPPNGQGIAALQMLQILEDYDLAEMGFMSPEVVHLMVEAKRLAFEDRARFYADPDYSPAPIEALLSEDYADQRRELISSEQAMQEVSHGDPSVLEDGDTTYLTVADSNGMMVSLIQSNYRGMGSGLVPDGLGFMLQDRGELFSLEDGHPNVYAPNKRPFHTIIPAFITQNGQPWMSFGLMGGGMQPQGHVQIVSNMIDFGLNVQEAGDAARWRHDGSTEPTDPISTGGLGSLNVESGMPEETVAALRELGHQVTVQAGGYGGYQAIWRDPETGVYWAASEMRKDGAAIGY